MTWREIFMAFSMVGLSALIGWLTNWVAIKMLMRPVRPVRVLGLTLQGLLPRRQADLADRISEAIARDFLTEKDIADFLRKVEPGAALQRLIAQKWDEKAEEILSVIPLVRVFLSDEKLATIRDRVAETFGREGEGFAQELVHTLEGKIDLKDTVRRNILAFDVERLESIIEEIAKKEFREIELLGGVLGGLIGLIQVGIALAFR